MRAYSLDPGAGEAIWMFDSLDRVKADATHTDGSFSLVEFHDSEGSAVPVHVHERFDRGFFVTEGSYTFVVDDARRSVSAGGWVFVPRGVAHAWRCDTPTGRCINVTVPGGFEDFYRAVGEPVTGDELPSRREPEIEVLARAAAGFGVTIVGPPPSRSAASS